MRFLPCFCFSNSLRFLHVYPNPATDLLYLENIPAQSAEFSIFNTLGQTVMTGTSNGTLSVSGLGKGLYFVQVKGDNWQKTAKFVVK